MKKIVITIVVAIFGIAAASAQKFALVDMEYILGNIPAYTTANQQLQQLSERWQQEVDIAQKKAEIVYEKYQKERPYLTDEQKQNYENSVVEKEKAASELRYKYFGPEGELFLRRQVYLEPIQNEIYEAIKKISEEQGYQAIFDRATSNNILFASPKIDISDLVLQKLGYLK